MWTDLLLVDYPSTRSFSFSQLAIFLLIPNLNMDSDKLEQIKENVKPLREGRAITTLMKSALSDDTAAAKTREETRR